MTVVAYRDGLMSADSSCWIGDSEVTKIKKIYRIKNGLIGMAGDYHSIMRFVKWAKEGWDEDEFPENSILEAIVVDPQGRVTLWEGAAYCPCPLRAPYTAIGAGADFAMGAMFAGGTAEMAVRAAIKHNAKCSGPVSTYRLSKDNT